MRHIAQHVRDHLPADMQPYAHLGEQRWLAQVYFGSDRRIHYEVSRPWSKSGRRLEIGLHLESRNKPFNREVIACFDQQLLTIRHALDEDVWAEPWDRGWTKLYFACADEDLTENHARATARRMARFITVVQPIYEHIRAGL